MAEETVSVALKFRQKVMQSSKYAFTASSENSTVSLLPTAASPAQAAPLFLFQGQPQVALLEGFATEPFGFRPHEGPDYWTKQRLSFGAKLAAVFQLAQD